MAGICKLKITETVEELKSLLTEQKTASGFQKIQALYLLKISQVKTVKDVAITLGVNRITIQRWFRKYRSQGLSALLQGNLNGGRKPAIPPQALVGLKQQLNNPQNNFKTYSDIQTWLKQEYDLEVSYKVVYATVRYQLKMTINKS